MLFRYATKSIAPRGRSYSHDPQLAAGFYICRLFDRSQVAKHGLFIWEVVAAHVATAPKLPQTVHDHGDGAFMVSGRTRSRRSRFRPGML